MNRYLPIAFLLLTLAAPAHAAGRAALEQHLMRLSEGAVTLGRTPADASVQVVVGLPWRNRAALDQLIRDLADPQSPRYQRFLTPAEFERRFAPRAAQLAALRRYLRSAGLAIAHTSRSRLLVTAVGRADRVERALATRLVEVFDRGRRQTVTAERPALPPELDAQVVGVGAGMALRTPQERALRASDLPLDPAEAASRYSFDGLYARGIAGDDTRTSTVAIATAFGFDAEDLQGFWADHGIARSPDSVELISVQGRSAVSAPGDRLETTLDVEWASAMAPRARVLVYAGSDALAPTFLHVYDRIVTENRAAVLSTSWGRCEADYPDSYLDQVDAVFARAAAQGITIVAAAGDRGAFECDDLEAPSVAFPASHPYVLAVGGTTLRDDGGTLREVAWSGSGGGISARYPAPPWQMSAEANRVLADVALSADPESGYVVRHDGASLTVGGTSVAAPIWAALLALSNQSRAAAGRDPVGLAAPALCELGLATDLAAAPFVDITEGDNGAFAAGPGFDVPTGWGVPSAAVLAAALSEWSPPADGRGGSSLMLALPAAAADVEGSARVRFERRCLATSADLQARRLPPGEYTVDVDGVPAASFSPDGRGTVMLTLIGIDLRGHRVEIRALGGRVLFSSAARVDPPPDTVREVHAELISTGMMPAARGSLEYRASAGRDQLTVRASGLPDGSFDVRLGAQTIGTLTVRGGSGAVAQFDSQGQSGQVLRTSLLCKPVILSRNGSAYLRSATDALAPGQCG